jgi:hypothetical protein
MRGFDSAATPAEAATAARATWENCSRLALDTLLNKPPCGSSSSATQATEKPICTGGRQQWSCIAHCSWRSCAAEASQADATPAMCRCQAQHDKAGAGNGLHHSCAPGNRLKSVHRVLKAPHQHVLATEQ